METEIDQINNSIAKHYCTVIHSNLVGKIPHNKPKAHLFYIDAVTNFIDRQYKLSELLMANIEEIVKIYKKDTGNILTIDMFINAFVENYTFMKVFNNIEYNKVIDIMNTIIRSSLIEYFKWINICDNKAYFNIELTEEQKNTMKSKMINIIHINGIEEKFRMYNPDGQTVPMKLFRELKNQYDELKSRLS